jgi:hypothetical protein
VQRDEHLDNLRWNWEGAYVINHLDDGRWLAQRCDDRTALTADSPEELADAIQADYSARPVPREPE